MFRYKLNLAVKLNNVFILKKMSGLSHPDLFYSKFKINKFIPLQINDTRFPDTITMAYIDLVGSWSDPGTRDIILVRAAPRGNQQEN